MSIARRVTINALAIFSSQASTTLFRLVFFVFAARFLGPGRLGIYALILTLTTFFLLTADLGISTLITRDVARDKDKAREYISKGLPLVVLASLASYLLLLGTTKVLGYGFEKNILAAIGGLYIFTETLMRFFDAPLKAFERMEIGAALTSLYGLLSSALGILALFLGYGLRGVFWAIFGSSFVCTVLLAWIIKKHFIDFGVQIDRVFWGKVLKQSLAYGALGAVGFISFKVDTVMLSKMKGDAVVGWYNASYKILENLLLVPTSLVVALFPVMSLLHKTSLDQLRIIYQRAVKYLFVIGLPLAVALTAFASPLVLVIFGSKYAPSVAPLQILAWAVLAMFVNAPNIHLLASGDRQYVLLRWFTAFVFLNVLLNFLLIPRFSLLGASIATLVSEMLAFAAYYLMIRKYLAGVLIFRFWAKPMIAATVMAGVFLLLYQISIGLAMVVGLVAYGIAVVLLGTFKAEEYQQVLSVFKMGEPLSTWLRE